MLPTALCLLPTVLIWFAPTPCIGPRPFASASGRRPQSLVYTTATLLVNNEFRLQYKIYECRQKVVNFSHREEKISWEGI
jgi:hypothetical protein